MAVDLSTMTEAELTVLIGQVQDTLAAREATRQVNVKKSDAAVANSIAQLTALIGPDNPTVAGQNSITEMRLYPVSVLQANPGQAISLMLQGMEILARTTRDIARLRSGQFS